MLLFFFVCLIMETRGAHKNYEMAIVQMMNLEMNWLQFIAYIYAMDISFIFEKFSSSSSTCSPNSVDLVCAIFYSLPHSMSLWQRQQQNKKSYFFLSIFLFVCSKSFVFSLPGVIWIIFEKSVCTLHSFMGSVIDAPKAFSLFYTPPSYPKSLFPQFLFKL